MNNKLIKLSSLLVSFITVLVFSSSGVALAAHGSTNITKTSTRLTGNDVSWPQCNKVLPKGQAFGVVGVNDGLANNTNPCFTTELNWASQSKGGTGQSVAALYVNTANPGLTGTWWPTSNTYGGTTPNNPYGTCNGSDTSACAYMYGYAKAYDDANNRGVNTPSVYKWWLDVETANSWESNKTANTADLEGMTNYFESISATVGLYSTSTQWGQIVGSTSSTSDLNGLPSWIPGARSLSAAEANCSLSPLTKAGKVTLTQYVSSSFDYDYSCI
jgi:hypothetical protein